jgi:hypothetical protein
VAPAPEENDEEAKGDSHRREEVNFVGFH